ncbi:MAG: hypothetical protein ACRYFZ_23190 [Janthinobacterium lividum]
MLALPAGGHLPSGKPPAAGLGLWRARPNPLVGGHPRPGGLAGTGASRQL